LPGGSIEFEGAEERELLDGAVVADLVGEGGEEGEGGGRVAAVLGEDKGDATDAAPEGSAGLEEGAEGGEGGGEVDGGAIKGAPEREEGVEGEVLGAVEGRDTVEEEEERAPVRLGARSGGGVVEVRASAEAFEEHPGDVAEEGQGLGERRGEGVDGEEPEALPGGAGEGLGEGRGGVAAVLRGEGKAATGRAAEGGPEEVHDGHGQER
jgi:hypothetical protein